MARESMSSDQDTTDTGKAPGAPHAVEETPAEAAAPPKRAPRSRAKPASPKKAAAPKKIASKAKGAPRSRRASSAEASPPAKREEVSIPPTWSDLDEHGERASTAGAPAEVEPAGRPTLPAAGAAGVTEPRRRVPVQAEELAKLPKRGGLPWFAKAAAGLAAVACSVLLFRSSAPHRSPPPPAPTLAVNAASPPAPAPPAVDTIAPVADTLAAPSAAEDKRASLRALEEWKLAEAIAAGERAVALDPTDGDAWLVLGAAYQNRGDVAGARRCYLACTKQATRGEVRECGFLLK
jgi:hypothetical protein